MAELRWVGASLPRPDAEAKVTGVQRYMSEVAVPGALHGRVLRLPYPRARLRRVETARAAALPGVLAVLTAQDLGDPVPRFGPVRGDRPLLANGEVRYQGEPVAAIAAENEAAATAALAAIKVDCDELPAVSDLDAALAPGAPVVAHAASYGAVVADGGDGHAPAAGDGRVGNGNVLESFRFGWGEAPSRAACVIEREFEFPATHHYAIEPHACIASWGASGLDVWAAVQHPFQLRRILAATFGLPLSAVRVLSSQVGGSFGGKGYPKLEPLAAALSRAVGRPVRLELSVQEALAETRRAGARIKFRTGADEDGTLCFQEVWADFMVGAYADVSLRVVEKAGYLACGPYRTPGARVEARAIASNTSPSTAFRGFGAPQLVWALESQMDELAHALGRDPLEFRLANLCRRGDVVVPGDTPADGDWAEGLTRAAAAIGWNETRDDAELGRPRGRGLAVAIKAPIPGSNTSAIVRLHADASASVLVGTTEVGQGSRAAMAQIAGEALGVAPERISVPDPDTASTPFDISTASSRSTVMAGSAVLAACLDLTTKLAAIAREVLGPEAKVDTGSGTITSPGREALGYDTLLERHFGPMQGGEVIGVGTYRGQRSPDLVLGGPVPFWEVGFAATEVEVDEDTGHLKVLRLVSVADVGRAINPALVEGQDLGAVVMALGHTLTEELRYDEGRLLNGTPADYRIPAAALTPAELGSVLVENEDGPGPFGAKGVGESGILTVAPAAANALFAAAGIRVRALPLTAERVWRALVARRAEARQETASHLSS